MYKKKTANQKIILNKKKEATLCRDNYNFLFLKHAAHESIFLNKDKKIFKNYLCVSGNNKKNVCVFFTTQSHKQYRLIKNVTKNYF